MHVLLAGGSAALARLFPDVEREILEAGAVKTRLNRDFLFEVPGYDPFPRRDIGIEMLCQSRPLVEWIAGARSRGSPMSKSAPAPA